MDYNYENLQASFSLDETFPVNGSNIDFLCQTYLGEMSSFPLDQASGYSLMPQNTEAFRQIPIRQWQGEECEEWAKSVLSHYGVDPMSVDLWSFRTKSGQELLQFTSMDFSDLVGHQYGNTFYQAFRQLSSKDTQQNVNRFRQQSESNFLEERSIYEPLTQEETQELDLYIPEEEPWPPTNSDDAFGDVSYYNVQGHNPLVQELEDLELEEAFVQIPGGGFLDNDEDETDAGEGGAALPIPSEVMLGKIQSKNRKRARGPKNWEFLMRLLVDPRTNPSIIEWEDEASATFRLKQPSIIARMWASRNPDQSDLSYNNFARGLRHHYKTGTLQPIPERQLVYRCGTKALEFLKEIRKISS